MASTGQHQQGSPGTRQPQELLLARENIPPTEAHAVVCDPVASATSRQQASTLALENVFEGCTDTTFCEGGL